VACFLKLHEIKLGPRNTMNPPVYPLSFGHLAQPASKNPLRICDADDTN
jgi:hypothetical protein